MPLTLGTPAARSIPRLRTPLACDIVWRDGVEFQAALVAEAHPPLEPLTQVWRRHSRSTCLGHVPLEDRSTIELLLRWEVTKNSFFAKETHPPTLGVTRATSKRLRSSLMRVGLDRNARMVDPLIFCLTPHGATRRLWPEAQEWLRSTQSVSQDHWEVVTGAPPVWRPFNHGGFQDYSFLYGEVVGTSGTFEQWLEGLTLLRKGEASWSSLRWALEAVQGPLQGLPLPLAMSLAPALGPPLRELATWTAGTPPEPPPFLGFTSGR